MNLPATAQSRVCKSCGIEKPASDFHKDKKMASGLRADCKPCRANLDKYTRVKRLYGLSRSEYDNLNNTHCPICGSEEPLVVDHDHCTSEVRGLICDSCNLGLGKFKDNVEALKNAIAYLNNEPLREITI